MEISEEVSQRPLQAGVGVEDSHPFPIQMYQPFLHLLKQEAGESVFSAELNSIATDMKSKFEGEPPVFFSEVWKKRKSEYQQLCAALKISSSIYDDLPLFLVCRLIASESSNLGWTFQSWNTLPIKVKNILNKYMQNNSPMNLMSFSDNEFKKKYSELMSHYQEIYKEILQLKDELALSKDYQELQKKSELFVRAGALKEQQIISLQSEKKELERDRDKLSAKNKSQATTLESYVRQNQKLKQELERLSEKLDSADVSEKFLLDEIRALELKIVRLMDENRLLLLKRFVPFEAFLTLKEKQQNLNSNNNANEPEKENSKQSFAHSNPSFFSAPRTESSRAFPDKAPIDLARESKDKIALLYKTTEEMFDDLKRTIKSVSF